MSELWVTTCALSRAGRGLAGDSQAVHRTLAYALGGRGLWALPDPRTLVVQHAAPVDWHHALEGVVAHTHTIRRPRPAEGDTVSWALIGNPTSMGHRDRKRTLLPPERWRPWCEEKLAPGLRLLDIDAQALRPARGRRHDRTVTHARVLYSGRAIVADADALGELTASGVGRGKAYGCGLLVVGLTS